MINLEWMNLIKNKTYVNQIKIVKAGIQSVGWSSLIAKEISLGVLAPFPFTS